MNYKKIPLYVITAALLGTSPAVLAQGFNIGNTVELQKANRHYNNNEYALALEQYMQIVGSNEPDLKTARRIANSYRQLQRTQEAEAWYSKVVAMPGRAPENLYYYAEMLRSNGKYEEAKAQYEKWAEEQPAMAGKARELAESTEFALRESKKQPIATIQELPQLNSDRYSEFGPRPFEGGIVFTSDRSRGAESEVYGLTGRPYLQLYAAQQNGPGNWGSPELVQELSSAETHNATASVAKDNQKVYFTRSRNLAGNIDADPTRWTRPVKRKGGSNNLEIFSADRSGNRWSNIKPFAFNKVEEYSVGHPAVSSDGNVLYFVSDMPGGQGNTDIYYTTRQSDGSWGEPVNAGPVVNTAGKESYPYVDDNGVLYFSSNGHAGMGGLDIFMAEGTHGAWTTVTNMGQPVNSPKNDYGIMFTEAGKEGLLSSNRNSKNGTDNIYSFSLMARPVVVAVNAVDNTGAAMEGVKIDLRQKGVNESIAGATDNSGTYYLNGRVGEQYELRNTKSGFQSQVMQLVIPETAGDTLRVPVTMREAKSVVVIKTIKPNSAAIGNVNITVTRAGKNDTVKTVSNAAGEVVINGTVGDKFTVRGVKKGYLNQSLNVEIPEAAGDTLNYTMRFESDEADKPIVMENVYYDTGMSDIREDAAVELDKLVTLLNENPNISIEIGSHTDSRQTKKYNQKLSEERAKSVVDYLVSKGINMNRLRSKGYGESQLLNKCKDGVKCSEEQHQRNRRTEFKIIKK